MSPIYRLGCKRFLWVRRIWKITKRIEDGETTENWRRQDDEDVHPSIKEILGGQNKVAADQEIKKKTIEDVTKNQTKEF